MSIRNRGVAVSNQCARYSRGAEQLEQTEGVVDLVLFPAQPVVAVVPGADLAPVQAGQFRREHGVQIRLGVAADRRIGGVQGQVDEIVQVGEQAHLAELAHPRDEGQLHVGITRLERPVQSAQVVAVGFCELRFVDRVQDRLVVLVHQHDHAPPAAAVQRFQQRGEASRKRGVLEWRRTPPAQRVHQSGEPSRRRPVLGRGQLAHGVRVQLAGSLEVAAAEVQPHHRVAFRPVPAVVNCQTAE